MDKQAFSHTTSPSTGKRLGPASMAMHGALHSKDCSKTATDRHCRQISQICQRQRHQWLTTSRVPTPWSSKPPNPTTPPSSAHPKAIRPFARLSNRRDDNAPPPNATQSDTSLCRAHRHPSMSLNAALEHSFIFILICMLFRQGMEANDAQRHARPL
jgi:hypothetical protein